MSNPETATKNRPRSPFYLWRIVGQESSDSTAGTSEIRVITTSPAEVPDPHAAIEQATNGKYSFYYIDRIELVGEMPAVWHVAAHGEEPVVEPCERLEA